MLHVMMPLGRLVCWRQWDTGGSRAEETTKKETLAVLDALKNKSLYLVSYDGVSQEAFDHHVVDLAKAGSLQTILSDFYREAWPYSVYEEPYLRTDLPLVRHFYFAASRFLQRFDVPSFRDFSGNTGGVPTLVQSSSGGLFYARRKDIALRKNPSLNCRVRPAP